MLLPLFEYEYIFKQRIIEIQQFVGFYTGSAMFRPKCLVESLKAA